MKKITLFLVVITALTGCKKWLDVQPSDQIVDTELFSESMGFRNALNGIYIQAATKELYGKNLSWGLNSSLGQEYAVGLMGKDQQIAQDFDKEHANSKILIDGVWSVGFNTISNCNKLLKEIEMLPESGFLEGRAKRNLIIGEAKAMRALMHFELLRLYAASPKQEPNGLYIPYVSTYPAKANPPVATSKVIEQIVADLESAQSLVAENDTIVNQASLSGKMNAMLSGSGTVITGGVFFNYRMTRLNYVAIHGLLARVYLYAGNYAKAGEHAKYVYDNFGPHGRFKWWEFTPEDKATAPGVNKYIKLANDILFAIYDADLISNLATNGQGSYRLTTDVEQWFPASDRDFRAGLIKEAETDLNLQKGKVSEKWLEARTIYTDVLDQTTIIPVIRMSEVYYIYSEALFKEGKVNDALNVLNQVRNARGKLTTFSQTGEAAYYDELVTEYRRELLTEGQSLFTYKRLLRNIQRGTQVIPMDSRFTLPVPEKEQIF